MSTKITIGLFVLVLHASFMHGIIRI